MAIVSVVKTSGIPAQLAEGEQGIVGGFFAPLLDIETAKQATIAAFPSNALTTFGGKSWQGRMTGAPDATNGSVNNLFGTGLRFSANGNNSLMSGALTASRIELDLRQLAPQLGDMCDGPLRVRVWFATPVPNTTNFQFFHVAVASQQNSALYLAGGVGFNLGDGGLTTQAQIQHAGASPNYFLNPRVITSAVDVLDVRFSQPFAMSVRTGRYDASKANPWPVGDYQGTVASYPSGGGAFDTWVQAANATLGAGPGNNGLKVMLCTSTGAVAVPFNNFTVRRISIDQWRSGA